MDLDYIQRLQRRAWAEVDIGALKHNFNVVRELTPKSSKICCVIKADAYGHGAVRVAQLYESLGADFLAVSNIDEALTIRRAGIKSPMLILGYTPPYCAEILADQNISQCVYSYEYGKALEEEALKKNVKIAIHIKLDVGMGRIGFVLRDDDDSGFAQALSLCRSESFIKEGIFTHFPMADEGEAGIDVTKSQYDFFYQAIELFEKEGIHFEIRHCNNSAATLKFPQYALDMVRVGVSLYGIAPMGEDNMDLKNTLSLKTIVSNVKTIKAGDTVGYGCEYVAKNDVVIATLPIGYADGFKRENHKNASKIFVNGKLCSITGRICMDQTMIDVSDLGSVNTGDEVVIYGSGSPISLKDFAKSNKKIPYEIMCEISARVPRVYCENGEILAIRDSLV